MACCGERPRLVHRLSRASARVAIYHFSAKVIGRSSGRSAVAAAAYRSASALLDEREARTHDFSHKADVVHSEILLPDGAPEHWSDRSILWNAVEASEKRKDAQLALRVRPRSHPERAMRRMRIMAE